MLVDISELPLILSSKPVLKYIAKLGDMYKIKIYWLSS